MFDFIEELAFQISTTPTIENTLHFIIAYIGGNY